MVGKRKPVDGKVSRVAPNPSGVYFDGVRCRKGGYCSGAGKRSGAQNGYGTCGDEGISLVYAKAAKKRLELGGA